MPIQRPGVPHGPEVADGRRAAVGELVQVGLAHDHRARGQQPAGHFGVLVGHARVIDGARSGGAHARRVDVVFERNRNPMQRPAQLARADLRVGLPRHRQGLRLHHRDEGIQLGVINFDAPQAGLGELHRGDTARPQTRGRVGDGGDTG